MGKATLAFRWESTPLGAMSTWGESLRQMARMCFSTRFPVLIAWGPELTMIYNDGYRDMLGTHKRLIALGAPMAEVWEEVWDEIGPMVDHVLATREPTWVVDTPLMMNRSNFLEETFFTFSYSPLVDDHGDVVGILDIATETTEQVVSRRRLELIDALHAELQQTTGTPGELAVAAEKVLGAGADIGRCAVLVHAGVGPGLTTVGDEQLVQETGDEIVDQVMVTRNPAVVGSTIVLPLSATDHGTADGALVVEAASTRPFDASLRSFAMVAASTIAGALRSATIQQMQLDFLDARSRVLELEAERVRETSLTLQHSLLTAPPEPDHLHVVVRYQPAAADLAVGGDWYDAFLTKDGATTLVIGDATGHDHRAAATMGQLRGLIRAIAFDSGLPPADVLERTDRAIEGLGLGPAATATAVLARIERDPETQTSGTRTVRWSNAGHPHPVIIRADGTIEVLERKNDVLLGVLPEAHRTEHAVDIDNGDTLFFYTDGLTERRGTPPRERLVALLDALRGGHRRTLQDLADHVLDTLAPDHPGDDVALVLVRPYPEDEPRPVEAGPNARVPASLT